MLRKLTTKNFRKLTDNVFEFGAGLQVVRGANEAGKSTLLEAIGYALFGIKACRESLAQVVTWGKPERNLSVELIFALDGVEYIVQRSKAGAEINYDGGRVVGQTEVSAFVERLLGTETAVVSKLMLAPQGAIRGALSQGPKATMELIEDLADFGIIDRVVDLIQTNLLTGPTGMAEERIAHAAAVFAAAQVAEPTDLAAVVADIIRHGEDIRTKQSQIDTLWKPRHTQAQTAVQAAEIAKRHREGLKGQLERAQTAQKVHEQQRQDAVKAARLAPTPTTIATARRQLEIAENSARELLIFAQFGALGYPEVYWEGTRKDFDSELEAQQRRGGESARRNQTAAADIRVLEAQRINGTACGYCAKDLSEVPEVVAKNASIDARIAALRLEMGASAAENTAAGEEYAALQAVQKEAAAIESFLARYPDKVVPNMGFVPPKLGWSGSAVVGGVSVGDAKTMLNELEGQKAKADLALARCEALSAALNEDEAAVTRLGAEIAACNGADTLPALRAELEKVAAQYNQLSGDVAELKQAKALAEAELKVRQAAIETAKQALAAAEADVKKAETELAQLNFNNVLLKRVRAARPLIADRLWSIVLSAVSSYFSAMRGDKSVVTREGNAFKVDSVPIEGLSGSTLDILGLAIRLALTRTFLPMSPFLILDEPSAACDEARTTAMLGFLVAAGFPQTLLVTHEATSESVANDLIMI